CGPDHLMIRSGVKPEGFSIYGADEAGSTQPPCVHHAFGRLPILADALQDAGCDNADILVRGSGPGLHVREGRGVELVPGKWRGRAGQVRRPASGSRWVTRRWARPVAWHQSASVVSDRRTLLQLVCSGQRMPVSSKELRLGGERGRRLPSEVTSA